VDDADKASPKGGEGQQDKGRPVWTPPHTCTSGCHSLEGKLMQTLENKLTMNFQTKMSSKFPIMVIAGRFLSLVDKTTSFHFECQKKKRKKTLTVAESHQSMEPLVSFLHLLQRKVRKISCI